jgi:alkanesulfonate monooxygenase SsuD/methylene tetrahydromethanopterin reductase-like flavin-dependent oxidoreductase (luciferase family)
MKLGMFVMPLHDPEAPLAPLLAEDRECVIALDKLGYDEVFVGEHVTATAEPITDPLQFLATLIHSTSRIKLGTGVLNLSQHHPVQIAANAAMFDNLSGGRLLLGIGPGGLASDFETFGTFKADRNAMMVESIDMILKLWNSEPPWSMKGQFWNIEISKSVNRSVGIGHIIKPLQLPHPEIFTTAMNAVSGPATIAGERGWAMISANFVSHRNARSHWETYRAGAERAKRRADWSKWRLSRNIFVADSDAEARDYLARPGNAIRWYFDYFHRNLGSRGMLKIIKPFDREMSDEACNLEWMLENIVISGGPKTVLERLVAIVDEVGPFGGLTLAKNDWDDREANLKSYRLIAEDVAPKLGRYIEEKAGRRAAA